MERERRWNKRISLFMHATLYYGGLGLLQCKIIDISLDGVYVETGRIALSQDTNLQVVIGGFNSFYDEHYRFDAKIARVDERGAGLVFDDLELEGIRFLQGLIDYQKTDTSCVPQQGLAAR